MDIQTALDRLASGESRKSVLPKVLPDGFGEAYFGRIMATYGAENTVLARLGRHWEEIAGSVPDAAWVFRAGGIYERSRGQWMRSAQAFLSAGKSSRNRVARLSFQVGAIDSLARAGKIDDAERLAKRLANGLRRVGEPALAARSLLNLGNALVYQDRMKHARRVLSRALPELQSAGLILEATSARMALSSTHLFGGDPRAAIALAQEVVDAATASEAYYLADLGRLNLSLAMIITGRAEEAHRALLDLAPRLFDSSADRARVNEYLADALFRLNLWSESETAYLEVLRDRKHLIPLHCANVELGLGQSLLMQGELTTARSHLLKARRRYAGLNNRVWQAVCLHHLALIELEVGRKKRAIELLDAAEALAIESPVHLAAVLLSQSRAGKDRTDEADRLIRKYAYLDLHWQVHFLRATRSKNPGRHFRRMFNSILVGRLATRSVAAKLGFLKDKNDALVAYISWLLARPTKARVEEATSAINQIRSVTLIDEILNSAKLPESLLIEFGRIRSELETAVVESPSGTSRLLMVDAGSISRAQRSATQALLSIELRSSTHVGPSSDGVVLAQTANGLSVLHQSTASLPKLSNSELAVQLKWLSYEMLAPMADANIKPKAVNAILDRLANAFETIWNSDAKWICPDGVGWQIPWALCSERAGVQREWPIAMHPIFSAVYSARVTPKSRAVVWLGQSSDLPFANAEASNFADQFDDCLFVSTRAEALNMMESEFDVLHVASHAHHRPQNPMLSALLFPDGPLFAYEIARSGLKVGLTTLSACDTGSMSSINLTEPDGLARAFIARGSQSVVASQWPLDDEAASIQFRFFYQELIGGKDLESAIFSAKCICRAWRDHPYYWGALALYSGFIR